eukprot:14102311-Ditylum_brightwellii.AAC.2
MEIETSPTVNGVCSDAIKHSEETTKQTGTGNKRQARSTGKLAALNHAKKSHGKLALAHVNAKEINPAMATQECLQLIPEAMAKTPKWLNFKQKKKNDGRGVNFVGAITVLQISVKIEFTAKQAKVSYLI